MREENGERREMIPRNDASRFSETEGIIRRMEKKWKIMIHLMEKFSILSAVKTKRSNLESFLEIFAIIFYRLKSFFETDTFSPKLMISTN